MRKIYYFTIFFLCIVFLSGCGLDKFGENFGLNAVKEFDETIKKIIIEGGVGDEFIIRQKKQAEELSTQFKNDATQALDHASNEMDRQRAAINKDLSDKILEIQIALSASTGETREAGLLLLKQASDHLHEAIARAERFVYGYTIFLFNQTNYTIDKVFKYIGVIILFLLAGMLFYFLLFRKTYIIKTLTPVRIIIMVLIIVFICLFIIGDSNRSFAMKLIGRSEFPMPDFSSTASINTVEPNEIVKNQYPEMIVISGLNIIWCDNSIVGNQIVKLNGRTFKGNELEMINNGVISIIKISLPKNKVELKELFPDDKRTFKLQIYFVFNKREYEICSTERSFYQEPQFSSLIISQLTITSFPIPYSKYFNVDNVIEFSYKIENVGNHTSPKSVVSFFSGQDNRSQDQILYREIIPSLGPKESRIIRKSVKYDRPKEYIASVTFGQLAKKEKFDSTDYNQKIEVGIFPVKLYTVDAGSQIWKRTDTRLEKGQAFTVLYYQGSWKLANEDRENPILTTPLINKPLGYDNIKWPQALSPQYNLGAFLWKVGEPEIQNNYMCGFNNSFLANGDGPLFFVCNDTINYRAGYSDNTGSITVVVYYNN